WEFTHETRIFAAGNDTTWSWNNGVWSGMGTTTSLASLVNLSGTADGISFSGAYVTCGAYGGLQLLGCTLINSILKQCYISGGDTGVRTINITNTGEPRIINSYIGENYNVRSNSNSSIIYNANSNLQIIGSTFNQNSRGAGAGSLIRSDASIFIENSTFINNYMAYGAGCLALNGTSAIATINNSIFANNTQNSSTASASSSAIGSNGGSPVFKIANGSIVATNCTIINNKRLNEATYGTVAMMAAGSLELVNCVMWGNTGNGSLIANPLVSTNGSLNVTFTNCAYDTALTTNATTIRNSVNIAQGTSNAPGFVTESLVAAGVGATQNDCDKVSGYNLSLNSTSFLINSGDNNYASEFDLAGNVRIWNIAEGGVVDIGVYEYQKIASRFVDYLNLTDVAINETLPEIIASTVIYDNRMPISNWTLKFFSDAECTTEVVPNSQAEATYYVKAFDNTGHWIVANTDSFVVSSSLFAVYVNENYLRSYIAGSSVTGVVISSTNEKFVDTLLYTGIDSLSQS
ncbi:MAG: hypothetical protein ACRC37_05110, partial [Lentisphaeria bacterium]